MAYNNYFPQYYPNQMPVMQAQQQMPLQQPQMAQNSVQNAGNGITWVLGENAAKSFPVGAGQTVILMDREDPVMYMKSVDQSGMPQPLRIFDITERTTEKNSAAVKNSLTTDYVSRSEFEEFREDVKRTIKGIRKPKVEEEGEGSGIVTLRGIVNNPQSCFARYQVTFNGNIAIPNGGTVSPISVSIAIDGEPVLTSKAIFTPAAAADETPSDNNYGNVTSTAIVTVPKGCCFNVSVENTSTIPTTPAVEPIREVTIDRYNSSEFFRTISCKSAKDVWSVINNLMEMLKTTQPSLYNSVIRQLIKLK